MGAVVCLTGRGRSPACFDDVAAAAAAAAARLDDWASCNKSTISSVGLILGVDDLCVSFVLPFDPPKLARNAENLSSDASIWSAAF